MRSALAGIIGEGGLAVADECFNQPEAVRRTAASVDIVVIDLDLDSSRLARMEKLDHLLAAAQPAPVLIVTCNDDPTAVAIALHRGAAGVVFKNRSADVFLRALRAVLAGDAWVERSTVASVFPAAEAVRSSAPEEALTRRERQIVELVSEGLQNKMIAERLSIKHTTVRHHLTSIFEKLSVTNRLELMRKAYGEGSRTPFSSRR